ncbi:MAG TPA: right-handed parallel beta-helix repeat-containing protein [Pyrinomonadaceae bacterium]
MSHSFRRTAQMGAALVAIPAGLWFPLNSKLRFPGILRPSVRAWLLALTVLLGVGATVTGWRVQVSRTATTAPGSVISVNSLNNNTAAGDGFFSPLAADMSFVVGNTNDGGAGSLRQAIGAANANPGNDTITFSVSGTIMVTSTLPQIVSGMGTLTIDGSGQSITISRNNSVQVMVVNGGANLALLNLTISNSIGDTFPGVSAPFSGGGVENHGTLTISNSTFSGNNAIFSGGGVDNSHGTLTITNSTFFGNSAMYGGGVWNSGGTVTISNSTFSTNNALGASGGGGVETTNGTLTITNSTFSHNAGIGAGAVKHDNGTVTITNSTFSDNIGVGAGGVRNISGTIILKNSIVANSAGSNCAGAITDGGNNLRWPSSDTSCVGTFGDPKLAALANNGGPTQTMALQSASAAIDAGYPFFTPPPDYDQRGPGYPRVLNGRIDIGAYEFNLCENEANGTSCNDGNSCTPTDTCQSGMCTGSNPSADGTSCNDGNACSQTDTCQGGMCTASNPVVCTASDQCRVAGTCDPANGLCSNPPAPAGTSCNGTAGQCQFQDKCNGSGTCVDQGFWQEDERCNDGNACTRTDECSSGVCRGSNPVICTALDQCHEVGACDPANGTCANPAKANGSLCVDGNNCTQNDVCTGGSCAGTSAADQACDTGQLGICAAGSNQCQNEGIVCVQNQQPQAETCNGVDDDCDGQVDEGIPSQATSCGVGACARSGERSCVGGQFIDSCTPGAPSADVCNGVDDDCDGQVDEDIPSQPTQCGSGDCAGTGQLTCVNGQLVDSCTPKSNGTSCSDGNACTANDTCNNGQCASGLPPNCDDGNFCTTDSCNSASGCVHAPICTNPVQTRFVIGDRNAVVGNRVMFWGAQWASQNSLTGGKAPAAFKGHAPSTTPAVPSCGGRWQTNTGNNSGRPPNVPAYIIVMVASRITQLGSTISGNVPGMVVVQTDPGYDTNPGHPGTGTVVAVVCQGSMAELTAPSSESNFWFDLYWAIPIRIGSWFGV